MLDALQQMLLVQNALAAWRIDAVAIARRTKEIFARATLEDPVLGPLARQLDEAFLPRFRPTRLRWRNDWSADGQHYGPRTHAAIARRVVAHLEEHRPDLLAPPAGLEVPRAPLPARRIVEARRRARRAAPSPWCGRSTPARRPRPPRACARGTG